MELFINRSWIFLLIVVTINFDEFVTTQKNFKNFNITFPKRDPIERMKQEMDEKCFAICSNDATSTIVVQIATDNVTKINTPVIDDLMAIVYYKCADQITKNGPGKYEYHTFQKLCGNRTEKCKKFRTSFDKQWASLKTGEIPIMRVNFTVPDDTNQIKIKYQNCASEQIIFTFKVKNETIIFRREVNNYVLLNDVFTAYNLVKMPISLSVMQYKVETLANVEFNVKKVKMEKCSKVNQNYCYNLCSNNQMVAGTKCELKIKNDTVLIENRNITCQMPERINRTVINPTEIQRPFLVNNTTNGLCEYFTLKKLPPCESICIDLPNCSYMCIEKNENNLVELGYRGNIIENYIGSVGSGQWTFENIPNELVYLNECEYSSKLCTNSENCFDKPIGYSCINETYNQYECSKISSNKNRFWHCPIINIINSTLPKITSSILDKTKQILIDGQNIVKEPFSTKIKINKLMESAYKFSNEIKTSFKTTDLRQKKNVSNIMITTFESFIRQTLNMILNINKTSIVETTDTYDTYSSYINETDKEHIIPLSEKKSLPEKQFVTLKIKDRPTVQTEEKLITTFIRFKDMDILDESTEIENKIKISTILKVNNENVVQRFKNSDFISLTLNQNRKVAIHFKLQTFKNIDSPSWLFSFEEECGFLDENKSWEWSIDGCRKVKTQGNQYYCECDHLSNFAMLFSIRTVNTIHLKILKYLSLFGGIINIISLMFFLIFILLINSRDKLRLDQLNISICLLVGTIVFLLSGVATVNETLCKLVATFTQFSFLSAFVWKLILGVNVVRMIASLRYQNEDWMVKYRLATIGFGYGIPLLIVTISGCIYWKDYGEISDDVCWINTSSGAFLSFIIPIGIILAINLVALFFIANALIRNYLDTRKTKVNESNELLVFLQLVVSMGLTWIPSYFAIAYLFAMYMWVIFFPLQGLMMFLFVVVINRENRDKVSSFVQEKYSSLISKSTTNSDTRTHSKSKSSHSKITEHNQSLLSENDKEKEINAFPLVTITDQNDVTVPLKNPSC